MEKKKTQLKQKKEEMQKIKETEVNTLQVIAILFKFLKMKNVKLKIPGETKKEKGG